MNKIRSQHEAIVPHLIGQKIKLSNLFNNLTMAEEKNVKLSQQFTMAGKKNMKLALALQNANEGRPVENLQVELIMEILEYENNFA
jgi:hypothetical protein